MPAPHQKLRIIVGGMVGQFPLGGVAWDYFHYVLGLHELGHEVYYHEDTWVWPFNPRLMYPTDDPSYTVQFFTDFFGTYAPQLKDRWHYVLCHEKHYGISAEDFAEVARTADIFLNISGACFIPRELGPQCVKVFMDTDPGYNQFMLSEKFAWSQNVQRWCDSVAAHDRHLTYAENIYGRDCVIPRLDFDWQTTRCVVTLPEWDSIRQSPPSPIAPMTTIMTWDWFKGALTYKGTEYFAKVVEFEKFLDLPRRSQVGFMVALNGIKAPIQKIAPYGWIIRDAQEVTLTPARYQEFIGNSAGEWSVAKNVYVATHSGWFSCRTACYLAAGRPAVVQETGWSRFVPSGSGVIAFSTMEEAVAGLAAVAAEPARHQATAYEIAREYLAPDRVLPEMIDKIFAGRRDKAQTQGRAMSKPLTIVVGGYIVAYPLGGMTWHHLNYLCGLHELGHEVWFLEDSGSYSYPYNPVTWQTSADSTYGRDYLERTFSEYGLPKRYCYYSEFEDKHYGLSKAELNALLARADLLLCVSGVTPMRPERARPRRTAVIDTDPVFTQLRMIHDSQFLDYYKQFDRVATFGRLIGTPACPLPTHGFDWIPTNQPISLKFWHPALSAGSDFTTIGKWEHTADRNLEFEGKTYRSTKASEWMKMIDLPRRTPWKLTLGMQAMPNETADSFTAHGWNFINAEKATLSCESYMDFIQNSAGEFTVAKEIYAGLPSGWFSDRSSAYMASGRPVVTQASGFNQWLPTGEGLFSYQTVEEAADALDTIHYDYAKHSTAARKIAEKYFDSRSVLSGLLQRML